MRKAGESPAEPVDGRLVGVLATLIDLGLTPHDPKALDIAFR